MGCIDPSKGIYREILHTHPTTTPGVSGKDDNFISFHPCLAQHLLVENALTRLENIGVIAKVSHYCTSVVEESIQHRNVAHAEGALHRTREKKISTDPLPLCINLKAPARTVRKTILSKPAAHLRSSATSVGDMSTSTPTAWFAPWQLITRKTGAPIMVWSLWMMRLSCSVVATSLRRG